MKDELWIAPDGYDANGLYVGTGNTWSPRHTVRFTGDTVIVTYKCGEVRQYRKDFISCDEIQGWTLSREDKVKKLLDKIR